MRNSYFTRDIRGTLDSGYLWGECVCSHAVFGEVFKCRKLLCKSLFSVCGRIVRDSQSKLNPNHYTIALSSVHYGDQHNGSQQIQVRKANGEKVPHSYWACDKSQISSFCGQIDHCAVDRKELYAHYYYYYDCYSFFFLKRQRARDEGEWQRHGERVAVQVQCA